MKDIIKSNKKWTKSEISILKSHYKTKFDSEISRIIGRTTSAIKTKRRELGCIKTRDERRCLGERSPSWKGGLCKTQCCICSKHIMRSRWVINNYERFYCSDKCHRIGRSNRMKGENGPNWKNGTFSTSDGYLCLLVPNHPYCDTGGYVKEHRLVMERHLGRILKPEEIVHHIDGNKINNKISNLMLFKNQAEHIRFHSHNEESWGLKKREVLKDE